MSSDRTPADVIAGWAFRTYAGEPTGRQPDDVAQSILAALAAAGYRVVPIPDDNTRALAARLVTAADDFDADPAGTVWQITAESRLPADLRAAAALLDGQPEDRPAQCPTCGSATKAARIHQCLYVPDAWHVGGSGDTR